MKNIDFLLKPLIAHRGYFDNKLEIPENSIAAFKRAIEYNYTIELDVHYLRDGKVVVFHDDNLKRMTGLDKQVKDCTYNEIKDLKLLGTNQRIPLFEDVLNLVDGKVAILVELKYDTKVGLLEKEVLRLLEKYKGNVAVQSFRPRSVSYFKKSQIPSGQLISSKKNRKFSKSQEFLYIKMFLKTFIKPDFFSYNINLVDDFVKKISKDVKILSWTVRSKSQYEKYVKKCDNLICENFNFFN